MDNKYDRLIDGNGDRIRGRTSYVLRNKDWTLKNVLPTTFHLYRAPKNFSAPIGGFPPETYLGVLKAFSEIVLPPETFYEGSFLLVYFGNDEKKVLMFPPYKMKSFQKSLLIGTVGYDSTSGSKQHYTSYSDISGIFIVNHLNIPINIHFRGNLVAQTGANDGMDFLGGSSSTVYFDNNRQGFKIGDVLRFTYSLPNNKSHMFDVKLTNNYINRIHVGIINPNQEECRGDDVYSYRLDSFSISGVNYYLPVGNYNSISQNPSACF